MQDEKEPYITLFSNLSPKRADLVILVLTSQHIPAHAKKGQNGFIVLVPEIWKETAHKTIMTYDQENRFFGLRKKIAAIPISSFNSYPTFLIMGLITLIHLIDIRYQLHEQLVLNFGASSLYIILQGELYRSITALLLHSDTGHLLGNLAGMILFAAPLITLAGYGRGPLLVLLSGTSGNLINAWFYQTARISIGASTAIMGAAGLLSAYQIIQNRNSFSLNNFMPLVAGAVLVSLFSQGENTDVWAHIFGFISGFGLGIIYFYADKLYPGFLKNKIALATTLVLCTASFAWGMVLFAP